MTNSAIGESWDEAERELFTPEEIEESNRRVALIGEMQKTRQEKCLNQQEAEEHESLMGKTQAIVPIEQ